MARHTSIFLNMQDYRDQVPETQRFHLNEVQDPDFLPLSFRRRIEKLEEDVRVQGSISTVSSKLIWALPIVRQCVGSPQTPVADDPPMCL